MEGKSTLRVSESDGWGSEDGDARMKSERECEVGIEERRVSSEGCVAWSALHELRRERG